RRRPKRRREKRMSKASETKKPRVYEVAKDLGMSSEAVLQIVRRLGAEVKNHMSTLAPEVVEKVRGEISQKAAVVKEEQARKHEIELQRAREERARAAVIAATQPSSPSHPTPPGPAAPARPIGGGPSMDSRARGPRRRDRKKKKVVD